MIAAHVNAGALDRHQRRRHGLSEGGRRRSGAAWRLSRWCGSGRTTALASALLDGDGRPRSRWWPVAYAFQRVNDPRAAHGAARSLQRRRAADARVCGARPGRDQGSAGGRRRCVAAAEDAALPLAVRIQAVRGIAALGDARGGAVMRRLIASPRVDQNLQLEAITALAQLRDPAAVDLLIDLVSAQWPSVRAAALNALARTDVDTFISSISGARSRCALVGARRAGHDARRPRPRARAGAADACC